MGAAVVRTRIMAGATVLVEMSGVVEGEAADTLRRVLVDLLMRQRPPRVVVDATAAIRVDPMAIGTLTAAMETAADVGIDLVIIPGPMVGEILEDAA